ncbi:hypothetical protein [Deinococcus multiflagellatus]|uniref:Uncharacterized protein n=1 Tax=Deinococcus multiflagellatus TaxID=1656887 RepID=A0ABW1ZT36_9DEIO|nr:hypothetical protein [Deinococcus multiflagellatus]MBZ9714488.1 hypothetical protein [Deinococcus multiflagellatus]
MKRVRPAPALGVVARPSGPGRQYRSRNLEADVVGETVTLRAAGHEVTVRAPGRTDRERIEGALLGAPVHGRILRRAASTRARILQLRDQQGRPV